jgi:hypothetical protein
MRDGFGLPLSGFRNSIPKRPLALLPNPDAESRKPTLILALFLRKLTESALAVAKM